MQSITPPTIDDARSDGPAACTATNQSSAPVSEPRLGMLVVTGTAAPAAGRLNARVSSGPEARKKGSTIGARFASCRSKPQTIASSSWEEPAMAVTRSVAPSAGGPDALMPTIATTD